MITGQIPGRGDSRRRKAWILLVVLAAASYGVGESDSQGKLFEARGSTLEAFADKYLGEVLQYTVTLSPGAISVQRRFSVGIVHNEGSLREVLRLASSIWNVAFYLDETQKRILVTLPGEDRPVWTGGAEIEHLYVAPLPYDPTLFFSRDKTMCGPNCLALLSYALGKPVSPKDIADAAGFDPEYGTSMAGLAAAAKTLGLKAKGYKIDLDQYKRLRAPLIASVKLPEPHFVVISNYNDAGSFTVVDPPVTRFLSEDALREIFTGYVLILSN